MNDEEAAQVAARSMENMEAHETLNLLGHKAAIEQSQSTTILNYALARHNRSVAKRQRALANLFNRIADPATLAAAAALVAFVAWTQRRS